MILLKLGRVPFEWAILVLTVCVAIFSLDVTSRFFRVVFFVLLWLLFVLWIGSMIG